MNKYESEEGAGMKATNRGRQNERIHISGKFIAIHGEQAVKKLVKRIMENCEREMNHWRHEYIYRTIGTRYFWNFIYVGST